MERQEPYQFAAMEDRSAIRQRIVLPAKLRVSLVETFDTVVSNLSLAGFSATAGNPLEPKDVVWLTLPGLRPLKSEVVWWEDGNGGFAFEHLLAPFVLDDVLARCTDVPELQDRGPKYNSGRSSRQMRVRSC